MDEASSVCILQVEMMQHSSYQIYFIFVFRSSGDYKHSVFRCADRMPAELPVDELHGADSTWKNSGTRVHQYNSGSHADRAKHQQAASAHLLAQQ